MRLPLVCCSLALLVLAGCTSDEGAQPNGRGNVGPPMNGEGEVSLIKPDPNQGPAGGQVDDMTAPVGIAADMQGGQTATVFPDTDQPAGG